MDGKVMKMIADLKSGISALENAIGQNRYTDGEAFGNPEQDFDDPAVDVGGEDNKKAAFIALMKKKYKAE